MNVFLILQVSNLLISTCCEQNSIAIRACIISISYQFKKTGIGPSLLIASAGMYMTLHKSCRLCETNCMLMFELLISLFFYYCTSLSRGGYACVFFLFVLFLFFFFYWEAPPGCPNCDPSITIFDRKGPPFILL